MTIKTNFKANNDLAECDRLIRTLESKERSERGQYGLQNMQVAYLAATMPQDALDEYERVNKSANTFEDLEEIADPEISVRDVEDHVTNRLSGSAEVLNNRRKWLQIQWDRFELCWNIDDLYRFVSDLAKGDAMYNSAMYEIYGDAYNKEKEFDSYSLFPIERREREIRKNTSFKIQSYQKMIVNELDSISTMKALYGVINKVAVFDKAQGTDTFGVIRWSFFEAENRIRREMRQAKAVSTSVFKPCVLKKGAAAEMVDRVGRYQQLIAQGWAKG